jgi:hypothetical protein
MIRSLIRIQTHEDSISFNVPTLLYRFRQDEPLQRYIVVKPKGMTIQIMLDET